MASSKSGQRESYSNATALLLLTIQVAFAASFLPSLVKVTLRTGRVVRGRQTFISSSSVARTSRAGSSIDDAAKQTSSTSFDTFSASVLRILSQTEAEKVMDTMIMPSKEYGDRIQIGRDAQGLDPSVPVSPNDPCMAFTYGEFPLPSMDMLLDLATAYLTGGSRTTESTKLVDVGSGCGRLVLYAALSRPNCNAHGIEISKLLHGVGVSCIGTGSSNTDALFGPFLEGEDSATKSSVHLHCAPADEATGILKDADLVFCYSTVWPSSDFSPDLGAMIIGPEWSVLLSKACKKGCVVITTDRVLDPQYGWDLVERLDVPNPEVMGSTGYIQVLK